MSSTLVPAIYAALVRDLGWDPLAEARARRVTTEPFTAPLPLPSRARHGGHR